MKRSQAFSIVEVVIALGVVAFALVAILGVFPAALTQNRKGISDTRAAQLSKMMVATIDAQSANFAGIVCFGRTLDLTSLVKDGPAMQWYAGYPSPNVPEITSVKNASSIYSIEMKFDNNPQVAPGVTLPAGTLNQLQIRFRGLAITSPDFTEFMYLARKKG